MKYTLSKEDIIEMLRTWDVPQLNMALDNGISSEDFVNKHKSDILVECLLRKSEHIFLRVLSKPFDFNKNNFLYLHHAVRSNELFFVQKLIEKMDLESRNKKDPHSNRTALHIACEQNAQDIAKFLSENNFNWEDQDNLKQTPLHLLLRNAPYINAELIQEIKNKNINLNKKDCMQICCKDIIRSFSFDSEWMELEQNKLLIKELSIK